MAQRSQLFPCLGFYQGDVAVARDLPIHLLSWVSCALLILGYVPASACCYLSGGKACGLRTYRDQRPKDGVIRGD